MVSRGRCGNLTGPGDGEEFQEMQAQGEPCEARQSHRHGNGEEFQESADPEKPHL